MRFAKARDLARLRVAFFRQGAVVVARCGSIRVRVAEQVEEHWPQVHAWHSEDGTKDYIRVIGIMLAEKAERNEDVETLVNMLGRSSKPKVREYLRTPCVKLPEGAAALLLAEAKSWCGMVDGSM